MRFVRAFLLFMLIFSSAQPIMAQKNFTLAKATYKKVPFKIQLFARVIPQRIYKISSDLSGRLSSLKINVGDTVDKNTVIANIKSSVITAKLQTLNEKILQDKKKLLVAQSVLKMVSQEYRQRIVAQRRLLQAKIKVQEAKTSLKTLQIRLRSLQVRTQLRTCVNGRVFNIFASNGNYIKLGQTVLTVLPNANRLLARAYGQEGRQIKIGQHGWFQAQGNLTPLLVSVSAMIPDPNVPGTWRIYLNSVDPHPQWFTGEAGTLKLINKTHSLIAVSKRALILDQGKWWVIKKTDHGFVRVQVFPLISNKQWVWLKRGLNEGDEIVVAGAYQIFHRNFSKNYANPD